MAVTISKLCFSLYCNQKITYSDAKAEYWSGKISFKLEGKSPNTVRYILVGTLQIVSWSLW